MIKLLRNLLNRSVTKISILFIAVLLLSNLAVFALEDQDVVQIMNDSFNPGIIAIITQQQVDQAKQMAFDIIKDELDNLAVDDINDGATHISNISGNFTLNSADDIVVEMDEANNAIKLTMNNMQMNMSADLKIRTMFLNIDGTMSIDGLVRSASVHMRLDTQPKCIHLIPKLVAQSVEIDIDADQTDINVNCQNCQETLINSVIDAVEDNVLAEIADALEGAIMNSMPVMLNHAINDWYPTEYELIDGANISLGITSAWTVKSDHIIAPIDGTIFAVEQGYQRPANGEELSAEIVENSNNVTMLISDYVYKSFEKTVESLPMTHQMEVAGFSAEFQNGGDNYGLSLTNEEGKVKVAFDTLASVPEYNVSFFIKTEAEVKISLLPGDENNMLFIKPELVADSLDFEVTKYYISGKEVQQDGLSRMIADALKQAVEDYEFAPMGIRRMEGFPFEISSASLDFHSGHAELGF